MAYEGTDPITNITDNLDGWNPPDYKAYQLRDYLDFRAVFGTGAVSILRLMANRSAHLYGELVLHDGGVRSFDTFGFTCLDSAQDIASFRSGEASGTEKVRITVDGDVEAQGDLKADAQLQGTSSSGFKLLAQTATGTDKDLTLQAASIIHYVLDGSTTERWGTMDIASSDRRLLIDDKNDATQQLILNSKNLVLACQLGSAGTIFKVQNDSAVSRFEVKQSGDVVDFHGNDLTIDQDVNLSSLDGGNMLAITGSNTAASPLVVHFRGVTAIGGGGGTQDYTIRPADKIRVVDVVVVKTAANAGGSDWVRILRGTSTPITDAISLGNDQSIARPTTINDSYYNVDTDQDLVIRASEGSSGNCACKVYVFCIRVV